MSIILTFWAVFVVSRYKQDFVLCCEQFTTSGLAQKERRDSERAKFNDTFSQACLRNQELSVEKINEFDKDKSKVRLILHSFNWIKTDH